MSDTHRRQVKIIKNDMGNWVCPATGDKFYINEVPRLPDITFEIQTDVAPPYNWKWTLIWTAQVSGLRESAKRGHALKTFTETGSFTSQDKKWVAVFNEKILGGKLVVEVTAGSTEFRRTVFVLGKNPSKENVVSYIASMPNTLGFDKVVDQESHFKNFISADGEPVVAGDRGYGMTQMTNPAPNYEQIWNWQENIKAGVRLFQQKQREARETFTRWNGGSYYKWNSSTQQLERQNILCDPSQGNIGWDMNNPSNAGKTEGQLHDRDKDKYHEMQAGQSADHPWKYSGVCYVDHLLGP